MATFLTYDYATWQYGLPLFGWLFLIIWVRYLGLAFIVSLITQWIAKTAVHRQLSHVATTKVQRRKEIGWSTITSLFFALSGTLLVIAWQRDYTQLYWDSKAYPLWMPALSIGMALLLHETYYYWLHRWMHRPKVYRMIHKVHHDSMHTSATTAFSFHPYEAILQALIIPVIVLIVPMHVYAFLGWLLLMGISGTLNHAGVEMYPHWLLKYPPGRWLIGATHHDLHHKQFRYNFGLYFTFWDYWMRTESPKYNKVVDEMTVNNKSTSTKR